MLCLVHGAPLYVRGVVCFVCVQGRTGGELAASYARTDLTRVGKCVPAAQKFSHSDPHEPPPEYFATVSQLAHGKMLGSPRLQHLNSHCRRGGRAQHNPSAVERGSHVTRLGGRRAVHADMLFLEAWVTMHNRLRNNEVQELSITTLL